MKEPEIANHWRTIVACGVGIGIGIMALPYSTIGLFIAPLEEEFGWTRGDISIGPSIMLGVITILSPLSGWLSDRFEAKRLIFVSLSAQSMCLFALSKLSGNLSELYLALAVMAACSIGASTIVFARIICTTFYRRRGLALGIVMTGNGVTATISPYTVGEVINLYGWSAGYALLSGVTIFCMGIILLLLGRDHDRRTEPETPAKVGGCTLREALARPDFWLMGTAFFLGTLASTGMVVHLIPYLMDIDIARSDALKIASLIGVGLIFARVITGWLLDRFEAKLVAASMMGLSSVGLLILSSGHPGAAIFGALAIGLCIGAELDIIGYLTGQHFGLTKYGQIYGVLYMLCAAGTAVSPIYYGFFYDHLRVYTPSILVGATFLSVAALLLFFLPPRSKLTSYQV